MILFQVGMGLLTFYIHDNPGLQLTTYIQTQYLNTSKEASIPELKLWVTVAEGIYIYILYIFIHLKYYAACSKEIFSKYN